MWWTSKLTVSSSFRFSAVIDIAHWIPLPNYNLFLWTQLRAQRIWLMINCEHMGISFSETWLNLVVPTRISEWPQQGRADNSDGQTYPLKALASGQVLFRKICGTLSVDLSNVRMRFWITMIVISADVSSSIKKDLRKLAEAQVLKNLRESQTESEKKSMKHFKFDLSIQWNCDIIWSFTQETHTVLSFCLNSPIVFFILFNATLSQMHCPTKTFPSLLSRETELWVSYRKSKWTAFKMKSGHKLYFVVSDDSACECLQ